MKANEYKYGKIGSEKIVSDKAYQRPLDTKRVKRIVDNFNPKLINPIKVSLRDGKYYVFDGQHTLKALVLRNGGKDLGVECKIYENLTQEQEAELFAEQNGISRSVDVASKMRAKHLAGDKEISELKECIESVGILFDFSKNKAANKIICYNAVSKIYKQYSADFLKDVLRIILEAWNGDEDSLRKEIISGLSLFCDTYKGMYDRAELVKKLSKVSAVQILRDGSVTRYGGDKRFARQILNVYNKKRTSNRLEDKF